MYESIGGCAVIVSKPPPCHLLAAVLQLLVCVLYSNASNKVATTRAVLAALQCIKAVAGGSMPDADTVIATMQSLMSSVACSAAPASSPSGRLLPGERVPDRASEPDSPIASRRQTAAINSPPDVRNQPRVRWAWLRCVSPCPCLVPAGLV